MVSNVIMNALHEDELELINELHQACQEGNAMRKEELVPLLYTWEIEVIIIFVRRGGRVAEGGSLLRSCRVNSPTAGSNPALSV